MKYNVYSVRDVKTGWLPPTYDISDISAQRNFAFAVNNESSIMSFAPSDFSLYCIGVFDTDSGEIEGCVPRFICDAVKE